MKIVMNPDNKALDEVIVVAYGTAKKSAFTGSAAVMKTEDIAKVADSNPVQALTGKVSGVQINTQTGQPGVENFKIRIRGISSINAGSTPLVIVDGSPWDGDMNDINPNDIASMTVLKDAASAALYGARGANGVVIITTKTGKEGSSSITVDAKWGSNSRATQDYKYVKSPAKYYETWYKGLYNYAKAQGMGNESAVAWANENLCSDNDYGLGYNVYTVPDGQYLIGSNGRINPNATLGRVYNYQGQDFMITPDDWTDATYQNSLRQEYAITATGSTDKSSFYGSANYLSNDGITKASNYKRFTGRLKADFQLRPWLKMGGNFSYSHANTNYLSTDDDGAAGSAGNVFALTTVAPIYPLYVRDGKGNILYNSEAKLNVYDYGDGEVNGMIRPYISQANPLSSNQLDTHNQESNTFNAVGFAEIRFLNDFKFTSTNSVMDSEARSTLTTNPYYGLYAASNGQVTKAHTRRWSYNYQQLLDWHHAFDKHDVDIMLGHEYYRTRYQSLDAYKTNMYSFDIPELSAAVNAGSADSYSDDYNTEGWFGRVQYNYAEKYFGSVSYRRDASSRFAPENRWGNFWALSGGWRVSGEEFMKEFDWVNDLKIRFGYGVTGNNDFDASYMANTLSRDQYWMLPSGSWAFVYGPSSNVNPYLGWEEKKEWNIGVDYSFFGNRMYGKFDYYRRKIDGMIYEVNVPQPPYPNGKQWQNIGEMESKGWEFEVGGDIIQNKDFTWTSSLNMSHNSGKILTMYGNNSRMDGNAMDEPGWPGDASRIEEGAEIGAFHMWKFAGFDDKGDFLLYNKDGEVIPASQKSVDDKQYIGNYLPKVMMGWNNTFTYKNFDLGINMRSWIGFDVLNTYPMYLGIQGQSGAGQWNLWKPALDDPKYKDIRGVKQLCDYFLEDGSFLKIDAITLGYTLALGKYTKWAERLRVYGTVGNVATITGYSGHNPEVNITGWEGGVDKVWNCDPIVRTYTLGIQVTF